MKEKERLNVFDDNDIEKQWGDMIIVKRQCMKEKSMKKTQI